MVVPSYHFSVDDVLESLLEVTDRGQELFEHEFFGFLRELHKQYDASVDLYLFLQRSGEGAVRSLADVTERLRPILQECPWLSFAPHARDAATPPYDQSPADQQAFCTGVFRHIARFAGAGRTSRWVRLHYFSESYELATYFRSHGVEVLLTTDKPAVSYRLPVPETKQLQQQGYTEFAGIHVVRSNIRVENLVGRSLDDDQLDAELNRMCPPNSCAVVFTHEYELARREVREMTLRVFSWLRRRQVIAPPRFALAGSESASRAILPRVEQESDRS